MVRAKSRKKIRRHAVPNFLQAYVDDSRDWCRGKIWWTRLLLLLLFAHITVCHLRDPLYSDIFKGLNLAFHEMGHALFSPFGEFMNIAGGSLFQCLVPLLSTMMFFRQRDYFGIAVCFAWLSTNLFDVATYAADARNLALPLVSPFGGGEETIHDWNYLLDKLNILHLDYLVAGSLRFSAVISMLICILAGSWLIFQMASQSGKKHQPDGKQEELPG